MDVNEVLEALMGKILGDPAEAEAYSQDPSGYLVDAGINDLDLSTVDLSQSVENVSNELNMGPQVSQTLAQVQAPAPAAPAPAAPAPAAHASAPAAHASASAAHASTPAPAPTMADVEQTINEYVQIRYEGETTITDNFVDNSTDIDVEIDGDVGGDYDDGYGYDYDDEGEVDINIHNDVVNATAQGDGSVAAGGEAEGVATGDGAIAAGDDIEYSQVNSGDGAVQVDGGNYGAINTGQNSGIIADGSVDDTIIGDGNTQVGDVYGSNVAVGDGNEINDVDTYGDAVVGDGNQTVQGEGNNAGFGSGDVTDFDDARIEGSQIAMGGSQIQDNDVTNTSTVTDSFNDESTNTSFDDHSLSVVDESTNDSYNMDDVGNVSDSGNYDLDVDVDANFEYDTSTTDSHDIGIVVEETYIEEYIEEAPEYEAPEPEVHEAPEPMDDMDMSDG